MPRAGGCGREVSGPDRPRRPPTATAAPLPLDTSRDRVSGMPDWSLPSWGASGGAHGILLREMLGELTLWARPDPSRRHRAGLRVDPECRLPPGADPARRVPDRAEGRGIRWVSDRRQMIYDESGMLLYVDALHGHLGAETCRGRATPPCRGGGVPADASMVTDAEWIVRYVNPAFEKVTGYGREEVSEESVYPRATGKHTGYLEIKDKVRSGFRGKAPEKPAEDGVHLELDIVISPIRGPGGKDRQPRGGLARHHPGSPAREAGPCGAAHGGGRHPRRRDRTRFQQRVDGIIGSRTCSACAREEPKLQGTWTRS